jgi:hypothetical protein
MARIAPQGFFLIPLRGAGFALPYNPLVFPPSIEVKALIPRGYGYP